MRLNFSIKSICSITGATFIDDNKTLPSIDIQNIIIDSRSPSISENTLFIALRGKKEHGNNFISDFKSKGGLFVLTDTRLHIDGINQLIVDNPLIALQKIASAHRKKFNIPVIGITGSNGKTIVKEWLYHMLKDDFAVVRSPKSYNSQIGVPLSILEMESEDEIAIIEAGISEPGEMEVLSEIIQPTVGLFTGLGDAHSVNFNSDKEKRGEKYRLFNKVEKLINLEDLTPNTNIPFADNASSLNAALIVETAKYFGLSTEKIEAKLKSLPTVSMRLEQIEAKNNSLLINDAYSSDLASLDIALKHLNSISQERERVIILTALDGISKEKARISLNQLLSRENIERVIFIGEKDYLPKDVVHDHYTSVEEFLEHPPEFKDSAILIKGSRNSALEKLVPLYATKKHITQLSVNLSALRHNLNYFRSKLDENVKVLAMVKAQSYGTGLREISTFLQQEKVEYFGVAYADEGVVLRKSGIEKPILIMNPEEGAFDDILTYNLEPSLYSTELLNAFIHKLILSGINKFPVHIKIDTGMHRLGIIEEQIDDLINTIKTQPEVYVKSVFSHLSVADDDSENEFTYGQIRKFEMMTGRMKDKLGYHFDRHIANSAGTVNYPRAHFDMVRLGIGLFGLLDPENNEIENVLTLTSRISQIKWVEEGESVGYGRSFIAHKKTRVGVIPVGYADGLRRGLSQGNWSLIIGEQNVPVIGNICMDMCMVDLTDVKADIGDLVEIFGEENSIFDMASTLYTIPYEIISGISTRVHRVYIEK